MADDGTLTRAADTRVDGIVVGEHSAAITTKGLVLSGEPGPAQPPAPPADVLARAGISVSLTSATELPDGILAGALRITYAQPDGTNLVYEVGGARATVTGTGTAGDRAGTDTASSAGESDAPGPSHTGPQDGNASAPPETLSDEAPASATDPFPAVPLAPSVPASEPFPPAAATPALPFPLPPLPSAGPERAGKTAAAAPSAPLSRVEAQGTLTQLGLARQLSTGPDVAPLFGGAIVLVLAAGALVLAAARRARTS
jgi:hypothetical protein